MERKQKNIEDLPGSKNVLVQESKNIREKIKTLKTDLVRTRENNSNV